MRTSLVWKLQHADRANSTNTYPDLQLTRDLEAVIFHDFSLSELGTDVPIHDVTLAQYKHASSLQGPQEALAAILNGDAKGVVGPRQRQRTFSTGEESMLRSLQLKERLLYTVDFQNKGFKPNTRGHSIQDTLATLDELLVKLPEDIGFNIEMSMLNASSTALRRRHITYTLTFKTEYPRLHEAVEAGVAPVTIDINTFIDTALEKLQRLAGRRPIMLSSFTPEVCILLSLKQKAYPVLFITNAGKVPMADRELRAASLQMGVHFARRWHLDGIVLACETFLHCPRFIKFVQNAGLVCASYGLLNNDPTSSRVSCFFLSFFLLSFFFFFF